VEILVPNFIRDSLHERGASFGYFGPSIRSYDLTYRGEYYSNAGLANNVEFRGALGEKTGFDLSYFGIPRHGCCLRKGGPSVLILWRDRPWCDGWELAA